MKALGARLIVVILAPAGNWSCPTRMPPPLRFSRRVAGVTSMELTGSRRPKLAFTYVHDAMWLVADRRVF